MSHNQFSPNSISHKDLNNLLKKAIKDKISINNDDETDIIIDKEFNNLISSWSETSKKILLMLNNKEEIIKDKNSKSLIALGAMGAHMNMALQALKSIELDT